MYTSMQPRSHSNALADSIVWKPIPQSDAAEYVSMATSSDNYSVLFAHTLSGFVILQSYIKLLSGDSYNASIYVHPHGERFGLRQLNEDNLFISMYGIALGAVFAVMRIVKTQWIMHIPPVRQTPYMALKLSLATTVYDGAKWAAVTLGGTYFLFFVFSGVVYGVAASFFGTWFSMLDTPVIRFSWYDLYLFTRMFLGGCLTIITWRMSDRVLDVYFAVPEMIVTTKYKNAYESLVTGLKDDKEPYIKAAAFAELAELSCRHPAQRVELFNDMGSSAANTAWIQVSRQCINLLTALGKEIEKEYVGVKPPVAPVPVRKEEAAPPNRIELQDMNVFSQPKKNTVYLDDRTSTLFTPVSTLGESVAGQDVEAPKHRVIKLLKLVEARVKQLEWVKQMSAVTAERKIRCLFSNYPVLLWATQSLGSLTAASYSEDPYGLVQRDIGLVLDTLLATVTDIERLIRSPPPSYKSLPRGHNGEVMLMEPEIVLLALREAIYQIVTAFQEYLDEIKVNKKYAKKWESFVEFRE
ncbi:nucleoporin protein Ndc1-Nup [Fennellomyces sp. T-0311]|nr:nucleoporin protein Ndc1-Nup [Fennellomyces sp. T-0311]